jgi:hypothetical protein
MIVAIIILAWLLLNTLATLVIICIDEGTPGKKVSNWIGVGLSCVLSPLAILFIIQPITTWITRFKRKRRKK